MSRLHTLVFELDTAVEFGAISQPCSARTMLPVKPLKDTGKVTLTMNSPVVRGDDEFRGVDPSSLYNATEGLGTNVRETAAVPGVAGNTEWLPPLFATYETAHTDESPSIWKLMYQSDSFAGSNDETEVTGEQPLNTTSSAPSL
jgi:hypothetical protein